MLRHLIITGAAALYAVLTVSSPQIRGDINLPAGAGPRNPYQVTTLCTAYPVNIGRRINVSNGAELQAALDTARGGDTIFLAVGATFRPDANGSFILRNRPVSDGQIIVIRSSHPAFDPQGAIPPNRRVDPSHATLMPHVLAVQRDRPAFRADAGAHGYRLVGLDIGVDPSISRVTNLVELGTGSDTTVDSEPFDITIDRCYLHGNDAGNFRRGVAMNGVRLAVIESYLENFHDADGDSQAIAGWNGAGPFKIVNNFLEAASENIIFGGADPAVPNLVPTDIEVRRNLGTKRLAWRSGGIPVKNVFELKNSRRVLVEGNVFEHSWVSGQDGPAIVLKSTNQDGRCPWCVTEYVTFRNNIVRSAANGVVIIGVENNQRNAPPPRVANHILVENVLFTDIGAREWGPEGGVLLRVFDGASDISFTHLTSPSNPSSILMPNGENDQNPRLTFKYNIVERRPYGIGAGDVEGTRTLERNFPGYVYGDNVLINTSQSTEQAISDSALAARYPSRTFVVPNVDSVGFEPGTFKLKPGSRFAQAGDDRKPLGADVAAIEVAQGGPGGSDCGSR